MNYNDYVQSMQVMAVIPLANTDNEFQEIIPRMIEYAELRIYRDFDFLATEIADATASTVAATRNVTLPSSIIVLQRINLITPASTAPASGTRKPLRRVSAAYLDAIWPTAATTTYGTPQIYALIGALSGSPSDSRGAYNIMLGPTPNSTYTLECIGTIRPAPLSATNDTTFISTYLPDVFLAASNIFLAGYQRNFSTQSADPQAGMSWEAVYQREKDAVNIEALRQRSMSSEWRSDLPPTPPAQSVAKS